MTLLNNPSTPSEAQPSHVLGHSGANLVDPILESRSFPEISQLVIASGHRLRTTLVCSIAFSILSAGTAFYFVPAQFLGSSTVRVLQREGYLLTTQQTRAEDASFVRAQQALVTQDQTLSTALQDKELNDLVGPISTDDPVFWIKSQIKAEMSVGSETMTITASNPSPELAVQVSRAVTQAYLAVITEQLRTSRERRIKELENTAAEVDEKLMQQWRLLQSKSGKIGSGNPQSVTVSEQLKLQSFRENSQSLRSLQFQRSQLELQFAAEQNAKPKAENLNELQIQTAISQHPEVVSLRDQIRKVDLKILEMKQLVQTDSAPQMVRLQNERKLYEDSLNQTEVKVASFTRKKLSNDFANPSPSAKAKELESQLALIDLEIKELQTTTTQLETSIVEASGPSGVELEIIRHEIEREERLADSLWKTIQELRIEARAEPRVAMGSLPSSSSRLSRAKQWKAVSGASAFGLALGILAIGFLEWSSRRIRYADEVVTQVRLPVIDAMTHKNGEQIANGMVAQLILRANPDGSLPSVFITSASAIEPRQRFAIDLAEAVATSGRRVLFVICDDNRPAASVSNSRTLGKAEATDWFTEIRSSEEHGFDYLNLGTGQVVLQEISSKSMTAFLSQANHHYDSLIVLGPAILSNAESVLIASSLDVAVLIVQIGQSRMDQLIAARNRLQLPNVNILGAVLVPDDRRATFHTKLLENSESDPFATDTRSSDVESEVLASVAELHGQIKQFDAAQSPIFPHLSPKPKQKHPSKNSRTIE